MPTEDIMKMPMRRPEQVGASITKELNVLLCAFADYHSHRRRTRPSFWIKERPQRDCRHTFPAYLGFQGIFKEV